MDDAARRRITEYVKPLAVGLDGMTYSGDVDRVAAASRKLAAGRDDLDLDVLYLLAVFSGQHKWVERMGHASRTEIFLASLGVPASRIRALFRGLARWKDAPSTPEEQIVHDALCLEDMGASGIVRHVREGYRDRLVLPEIADVIEEAAGRELRTPAGEALAEPRRQAMRDFAKRLREENEEFG